MENQYETLLFVIYATKDHNIGSKCMPLKQWASGWCYQDRFDVPRGDAKVIHASLDKKDILAKVSAIGETVCINDLARYFGWSGLYHDYLRTELEKSRTQFENWLISRGGK